MAYTNAIERECLVMISVSASLFQSYFRVEQREPAFQTQINGQHTPESQELAQNTLRQTLKDHMGLDLPAEQTVKGAMFDVDAVMDSVLQHVGARIEQAQADGASDQEIEDMLAAARSGVETGFAQAREQIDGLGKLDDALAEKIDTAQNGINLGLDDMEAVLLQSVGAGSDSSNDSPATTDDVPTTPTNDVPGSTTPTDETDDDQDGSTSIQYEKTFFQQKNKFSFKLVTQEGDKVTIKANSSYQLKERAISGESEQGSFDLYSASEKSKSGYSINVNGDLNDDEMAAIEDLLGQVNDLAGEFYQGDLSTAFDMALELDSDEDQIAQFSLNMRSKQVQKYQSASYTPQDTLPRGLMKPLAHFASGLQDAVHTADRFQQPKQLLQSMFEQMDANPKLHDLLRPMFNSMAA